MQTGRSRGLSILDEMKQFAAFPKATQRYIRRSLDVAFGQRDALRRWARDVDEARSIRDQAIVYQRIETVRDALADCHELVPTESLISPLTVMSAFDLSQGKIDGFGSYRFLYERLIGAAARPWLPAIYCSAAALPHLHPEMRRRLLRAIDEAAATPSGWSLHEPEFMPEWVDKVEVATA